MSTEASLATDVIEEEILGARITTLVDNQAAKPELGSVWGLSFHIEVQFPGRSEALLFDTSGSAQIFRNNVRILEIDFSNLRAIVISHFHHDHFGALAPALEVIRHRDLAVYLPTTHDAVEETLREAGIRRIIATEPQLIRSSISTTGALGPRTLKEHSLVINSLASGLVVVTGCAHPKVPRILQRAKKIFPGRPIFAVIGGLHLKTKEEGSEIGELFEKENVNLVSPCHCTTKQAKEALREIVGEGVYHENGSGAVISIQ